MTLIKDVTVELTPLITIKLLCKIFVNYLFITSVTVTVTVNYSFITSFFGLLKYKIWYLQTQSDRQINVDKKYKEIDYYTYLINV